VDRLGPGCRARHPGRAGHRARCPATDQVPPATPLDDALLTALLEVTSLERRGDVIVVTGTGNVVNAVLSVLVRRGIVAEQLRVDQPSLEAAFIALTGRTGRVAPSESAGG
jgi:ABC-2 type transport system ATP-binding protein